MDDLFAPLPTDAPTLDDQKDYFADLVGEDKKFKTPQELAKGKAHSDMFIEVLKKKADDLQAELKTRMSLEQFMTQMAERKPAEPAQPVLTPDTHPANLDAQSIEALVAEAIARREASKISETNKDRVSRVLQEQLGDQAQRAVNLKAQTLGMSTKDLQDLAVRSPQAFFGLMGINEGPRETFNTRVPVNTVQTNQQPNSGLHGKSFYEAMKRNDPKKYMSNETTVSMVKDMEKLGMEVFAAS